MPNWVDTIMKVHGNSDDLRSFMEKAAMPYTTYFKGKFIEPGVWDKDAIEEKVHDEPLSFMNFISPSDTETYYQNQRELNHGVAAERWRQYVHNDDPCQHPTTCINTAGHTNKDDQNWYYWNVNNWGTKWDACNIDVTSDDLESGSLEYRFSTAWSPAENAFRAMVQQHPELSFYFYNLEEQGWGVEYEGYEGELHETKNWDIPNSHQDWMSISDYCPACSNWDNDPASIYDDCRLRPRSTTDGMMYDDCSISADISTDGDSQLAS